MGCFDGEAITRRYRLMILYNKGEEKAKQTCWEITEHRPHKLLVSPPLRARLYGDLR